MAGKRLASVTYTDLSVAKPDSARPFRVWSPRESAFLRGRNYAGPRNAHWGALRHCSEELGVGQTLEVIDARNGKLLGQYKRRVNDVFFLRGD